MSRLDLVEHADGVVLPVRAHPGSRQNAITGIHAGALKVSVTQAPEKGKANKAIIALLAKKFCWAKRQLSILSGAAGSRKRILIRDADLREVSEKIEKLLG